MRLPLLLLAAATLAAGCTPLRSHQGYIIDADLVNSVRPGIDNRQSVQATMGRPSFASQFGTQDWYYVARDSRNYAFRNPHPVAQIVIKLSFDDAGNVTRIEKGGLDQIAKISPDGKTTPTLGRKRGFFQDLFGNIGTVGAGGLGSGGGAGGGSGGGRTGP